MPDIVLYMHAGSGNHGCEAIVNSMVGMLKCPAAVLSVNVGEDMTYSLKRFADEGRLTLWQERHIRLKSPGHIRCYAYRLLTGDAESYIRYRYHQAFGRHKPSLAVSIGGDNYCYEDTVADLILMNRAFHTKGVKTALLGCSVEPELLSDARIVEDMLRYHTIIARESLTFAALQGIGHPRLLLLPDPAFALAKKELPLPPGFDPANTLGINISPLVQTGERQSGITMAAYKTLLRHIISATDMQIALIPHVVWQRNDDRIPLRELYDTFAATGRVLMIADASAEELKGYIARLRFFIGARTHATIAAYSSLVPTLVLGYSVKARGIAADIFGTAENYVVPVQSLCGEDDLVTAFGWLVAHEEPIRSQLAAVMPAHIEKARTIGTELERIIKA